MLKSKSLIAALMSAALSIAAADAPRGYAPRGQAPTPRQAEGQTRNPTGSKLARKAAKGTLTGNHMTVAAQGIQRQFRKILEYRLNTPAMRKAHPLV
jgi:hypothetical protein